MFYDSKSILDNFRKKKIEIKNYKFHFSVNFLVFLVYFQKDKGEQN